MVQDKAKGEGVAEMQAIILEAAKELFLKKGFENVSMRAIASKIGYSPGAIYRYFENKKEILSALRHEAFGFFIERQKKFIPLEDPLERVRRAARFYVQFALEEPDWFELMFNMGPSTVALGGEWAARPQETFDMFRKDVAECVACKCFGDEDVDTLVFAIWSTMHGLANLAVKKRLDALAGDLDVNELADKVVAFTTRRA